MDKRGSLVMEEIIFILLNLVFFVVLLVFIVSNTRGIPLYEQVYAKKIAFMIDEAKPDMRIAIDLSELAKKSKKQVSEMIKINNEEKKVFVRMGRYGGRSYKFFSSAEITATPGTNYLILEIKEKNDKHY